MAKDPTEEGITGKKIRRKWGSDIPKNQRMSPANRYKFEKERREERKKRDDPRAGDSFSQHRMTGSRGHGSENVNTRTIRNHYEPITFKDFMSIIEQINAGPSTPVKYDAHMKQMVPNQGATRVGNVRMKKNTLDGV